MNFLQYVPTTGYATIQLEDFYSNLRGILIPEESNRAGYSGRIINISLTPKQRKTLGPETELMGHRCIVKAIGGIQVIERLYKFPVDHIEALLDEDALAEVPEESHPRCRFCGEVKGSKQGRLLVEVNGKKYCPNCKRDRRGVIVDPWEITPPNREQTELLTRDFPDKVREKFI